MSAKQHKPLDSTKLKNIFETNNILRDIVPDKIKIGLSPKRNNPPCTFYLR